jgi:hypothetical protein
MSYESILVINSGSTPSTDNTLDTTTVFANDERNKFLSKLGKTFTSDNNNYFYEISTVYDEPIASPLDTAFFICFLYDDSVSYQRFFRSTSSQIDKDLINRLSPQRALHLTHTHASAPTTGTATSSRHALSSLATETDS